MVPGDGEVHIYQIDMTGVVSGAVNVIRLDPGAVAVGETTSFLDVTAAGGRRGASTGSFDRTTEFFGVDSIFLTIQIYLSYSNP